MKFSKNLLLSIQIIISGAIILPTAVSATARHNSEQQRMMRMIEQLDQLDKMDFDEAIYKARRCILDRNFRCTEKLFKKAKKYAHGSKDKRILLAAKQELIEEKNLIKQEKAEIERQERAAERKRKRKKQREREEEQRREEEREAKNRRRLQQQAYDRNQRDNESRRQMIGAILTGVDDITNMYKEQSQFEANLERDVGNLMRQKSERSRQKRQNEERIERQQRADANARRARERDQKNRKRRAQQRKRQLEAEHQENMKRQDKKEKQRQTKRKRLERQRQAKRAAELLKKPSEAYCWRRKPSNKVFYHCYGPVQHVQYGEDSLESALSSSGCKDPSNTNQNNLMGWGKKNGAWFICFGHDLETYDNSPSKIGRWLSK